MPPPGGHPLALRTLDVAGALVGLVTLAPLILIAAIAIRVTSPGPAFFFQVRAGLNGRAFRCWKLRTMYQDAPDRLADLLEQPAFQAQWATQRKLSDDPRVTPVGRVLRSLDMDELPQLWNVLRGHMSLVGPRPVPHEETSLSGSAAGRILSVKPGMTGLWQVSGRNTVSRQERTRLDLQYVETRGLVTNLRLIAKTILLIALRRNGGT